MMNSSRYLIFIVFAFSCSNEPLPEIQNPPEFLPIFEVVVNNDNAFDGYIFLRESKSPGAQFAINRDGKIVWYLTSDTSILRTYTPYESSYLALYSVEGIEEISYDGDTLLKLSYGEGGFDRRLHHDVKKDSDGNIIALTREIIPYDLSTLGGEQSDTIKTDGIIKLSREGKKLWAWRLDQVINPETYPDINKVKDDWGHANALEVDVDGNYLISFRDFNQVWKINSKTGQIIWKYGASTDSTNESPFYQQHSINLNLDGDYMVFDNGNFRTRKYSRAVAFNKLSGDFQNTLVIDLPDSLFSFKQGSAYQIEKDRFLFSSPMAQALIITDRNGKILWMATSKHGFYRAYYLDKAILN